MALSLQIYILLLSIYLGYCEVNNKCIEKKRSPDTFRQDYYTVCSLSSLDSNLDMINPNDTTSLQIICVGSLTTMHKFPSAKFNHLPQLKELSIDDCAFSLLPTDAFQGLNNLTILEMVRSIRGIHTAIQTDLLCNMRNLEDLNITGYNLKHMDEIGCGVNNTCCSSNLAALQLGHNQITALQKKDFLHFPNLIILLLNFCEIESIENGTFDQLRDLQTLSLFQNKLIEIDEKLFLNNSPLQFLDLSGNRLSSLPVKIFHSLKSIQYLYMSDNSLFFNETSKDLFSKLNSLLQLGLNHNQIDYLPSGIFDSLKSLRKLFLHDNLIQKICEDDFRYLTQLEIFNLGNNIITEINPKSIRSLRKLQELALYSNRIKKLHNQTFSQSIKLEYILLNSNQISEIENGTFNVLKNLLYLNFSDNKIREMKQLFSPVRVMLELNDNEIDMFNFDSISTELRVINLDRNRIKRIAIGTEHPYKYNVQSFSAVDNQLQEFVLLLFPISIEVINLSNNNISKVIGISSKSYSNIRKIDLRNNSISEVKEKDNENFQFLSTIIVDDRIDPIINLSDNPLLCSCNNNWLISKKINDENILVDKQCLVIYNRMKQFSSKIDVNKLDRKDLLCQDKQNCPSQCNCFYNNLISEYILDCFNVSWQNPLPKLPVNVGTIFFDSNNNIGSVGKTLLQNSPMVLTLYMNNSDLVSMDGNVLEGVPNLIELHLEENNLVKITENEFHYTLKIEKLFLHQNQLEFISPNAFQNLYNLQFLTLHRNKLTNLDVWTIPPHLSEITFSNNPFICECNSTSKYQNWIGIKHKINFSDYNYTYCNGTTDLIMNYNDSKCSEVKVIRKEVIKEVNQMAVIVAPTVSIVLIFAIIMFLVYFYRVEMKVLLYSKYKFRLFHHNDLDNGKIYHAFVSYANEDDEWVNGILVSELDDYKLCLHHRDFVGGEFIADSIVNAVENSCRTIVILTPNYVKSSWCQFEFDTAHLQSAKDKCTRLIVVILEEVNNDEMNKNLRAYLKTNTYLRVKDSLFWKKLKYGLPDLKHVQENERETSNLEVFEESNTIE